MFRRRFCSCLAEDYSKPKSGEAGGEARAFGQRAAGSDGRRSRFRRLDHCLPMSSNGDSDFFLAFLGKSEEKQMKGPPYLCQWTTMS
jgi:hypothetical protein